ncbi:MAG: polysaccharide deacetylase family protein [Pyrinomonadaceae bacterium]
MKPTIYILILLILWQTAANAQQKTRFIAITIDDLPVVSLKNDLTARQEITQKLLKHITGAQIPAIGFVNETKLYQNGKRDEQEVNLLRQWLNAGLELGNHTFSHISLNSNPLEKYEDEIIRGEIITKELLQAKNMQMRYFRHPYLMTGKSMKIKRQLARFLAQHNYTIAPVTIDDDDYMFARVYDLAAERNDQNLRERVGAAYLPYMESKFDYWERQSVKLFGREPKQILLIHANSINAEYLDDLAAMLTKRGYKFVALENALSDEVYRLPDSYTKGWGISWLHRWALAKGKRYVLPDEPGVPNFVAEEYEKFQATRANNQ